MTAHSARYFTAAARDTNARIDLARAESEDEIAAAEEAVETTEADRDEARQRWSDALTAMGYAR